MRKRRVVASLTAVALVMGIMTACDSQRTGDFSVTAEGVTVEGPNANIETEPVIELAGDDEYKSAKAFKQVGEVVHISGELSGNVEVTLSVPSNYKGDLKDLWILKSDDSTTWVPLIPESMDEAGRTLSITTRGFSWWSLGTWHEEQAAAQLVADLRNLTSTDGAWVLSDAAKITGNAPVTECRYSALTLKLDVSKFVKSAIICPKVVETRADGSSLYDLYISNVQTYPVKIRLHDGITFEKVTPSPNNPVTQMMDTTARTKGVVTLPGAGELVLKVDSSKIPTGGAKITGELDFTTLMADMVFASIKGATGFDLASKNVHELSNLSEVVTFFACTVDGSQKLAKQLEKNPNVNFTEFAGMLSQTAFSCMKSDLLEALLKDYYRNLKVYSEEGLEKVLKTLPGRIVTTLETAPVLIAFASAIGTVKYGRTTYLLNVSNNDPVTSGLYKTLPEPGKGNFQPGQGPAAGPADGGQIIHVGTPCMIEEGQPQLWGEWTFSNAYGWYTRENIDTSVNITYVRPEYKDAVHTLFSGLAGKQDECEVRDKGAIVVLNKYSGQSYGNLTDYRVGIAGWEESEFMHYGLVSTYDPVKGVVIHITLQSSDPYSDVERSDIETQLQAALDYAAHKTDRSLGTSFTK